LVPNRVYVVPSHSFASLVDGIIQLTPKKSLKKPLRPIDYFFNSLSKQRGNPALGVLFSDPRFDGEEGLLALRTEGGITFTDSPKPPKDGSIGKNFNGTASTDFVMSAKQIAKEVVRIVRENAGQIPSEDELRKIFKIILDKFHVDIEHYKRSLILRQLARRMLLLKMKKFRSYVRVIKNDPDEAKALFSDILVRVTSFFRDPEVFDLLKKKIFPKMIRKRDPRRSLRVWVAGCSTGEEAYSIAMSLFDYLDRHSPDSPLQIFATDVNEESIREAKEGLYLDIESQVSRSGIEKHFDQVPGGYRIKRRIRDACLFSKQDITKDPPFGKVDLILCRNVLIYFDEQLQQTILPTFHFALNPGGVLLLGPSEGIGSLDPLFSTMFKGKKFFQKRDVRTPVRLYSHALQTATQVRKLEFSLDTEKNSFQADLEKELNRTVIKTYSPPSIVINDAMEVLLFRGRPTPFLKSETGSRSKNILKIVRQELVADLHKLIQAARMKNSDASKNGIRIADPDGVITFNLKVTPLQPSASLNQQIYAIFFELNPTIKEIRKFQKLKRSGSKTRGHSLKAQHLLDLELIKSTQEHALSLQEDYETTQKELMGFIEELKSKNEELTASHEELQASNDALTEIRETLQRQKDELMGLKNELVQVFSCAQIPLVMIGLDGRIRYFTPQAKTNFRLLSIDIGRRFEDLNPDLGQMDLRKITKDVLRSSISKAYEVQDSAGRWHQLNVRPYQLPDGKIQGVVISLIDIHDIKTALDATKIAEKTLTISQSDAFKILESNPIPFVVLKPNREILISNRAFHESFYPSGSLLGPGLSPGNTLKMTHLSDEEWNTPQLRSIIDKTFSGEAEFHNHEIEQSFPGIGRRVLLLNARRVKLPGSGVETVLMVLDDVTEKRRVESERAYALHLLQNVSKRVPGLVYQFLMKPDGSASIPFASDGIQRIYRLSHEEVQNDVEKIMALIHPEDRSSVIAAMNASAKDLSPWSLEYRVQFKDGGIRWVLGTAVAERTEEGGVLWSGYVSDITERKKYEQELAASEEKYRILVTSAYDGVMIVRSDGSIEFANVKIEKMFGYKPGELQNQPYDLLVRSQDRLKHSGHHKRFMENPSQRTMGQGLHLFGQRKDGSIFPIDVSLSPFKSKSEIYVNCVVRDITEIEKLEETRKRLVVQERALRDEAIRSNRKKDEFLATLSHELRTPLTTILGWTQQLMLKKLDDDIRNALLIIERSAKAQTRLIEDLLDVSRIQAGKISLSIQDIDLIETLGLAISSASVSAKKKKIQIDSHLPGVSCHVLADSFRLQQIFWNILNNAIKFTPFGGKISVKCEIVENPNGEFVRVQVADTGMGIKPEFIPHIFERFSQVDSSMTRVYGGLGLGLAIVKSL
ncbi:MAG: CheR family methyltransferase, partial [Bdellovibrio sp.]